MVHRSNDPFFLFRASHCRRSRGRWSSGSPTYISWRRPTDGHSPGRALLDAHSSCRSGCCHSWPTSGLDYARVPQLHLCTTGDDYSRGARSHQRSILHQECTTTRLVNNCTSAASLYQWCTITWLVNTCTSAASVHQCTITVLVNNCTNAVITPVVHKYTAREQLHKYHFIVTPGV